MTATERWWRAHIRIFLFVLINVVFVPIYVGAIGPLRRRQRGIKRIYFRLLARSLGLRVRVAGQQHRSGPVLFVSNHVSYLDIPVLGGALDGHFIAKAEVAKWPVFGVLAKLSKAMFIERQGSEAMGQRAEMLARLADGDNLILFPEGTTTDGGAVIPFKSSLFSIAERPPAGKELAIQPVSVAYPRYADGRRLDGDRRHLYSWHGDMTMVPHLMRVLRMKGAYVDVRIHPPLLPGDWANRKDLARRVHATVADGVAEAWEEPAAVSEQAAAAVSAAPRAASAGTRRSA
jgi:1-acyl-sn-glycerol-3-phosphate acyltransferase